MFGLGLPTALSLPGLSLRRGGLYGAASAAGDLLGDEASGMAIDFASSSMLIRNPGGTQYLGTPQDGLDVSRASSGTYFDSAGVMQTASANVLRLDHDPVTLAAKGVLIEGQRTNLLTYSEQFDNAAWTKTAVSIVSENTVAPNGTLTADKILPDGGTGHFLTGSSTAYTMGSIYCMSAYAAKNGYDFARLSFPGGAFSSNRQASFNLATGAVDGTDGVTANISDAGDGFFRIWIVSTATASASGYAHAITVNDVSSPSGSLSNFAPDGTSGIIYWGAQLEAGSTPSSYTRTEASQVTRAADQISIPTADFPYNGGSGVLTVNGNVVPPIIASSALDIDAIAAAEGLTHIETLKWVPA